MCTQRRSISADWGYSSWSIEVLVDGQIHEGVDLRLLPGLTERGQVLTGVAIEQQLVVDDLIGEVGQGLVLREAVLGEGLGERRGREENVVGGVADPASLVQRHHRSFRIGPHTLTPTPAAAAIRPAPCGVRRAGAVSQELPESVDMGVPHPDRPGHRAEPIALTGSMLVRTSRGGIGTGVGLLAGWIPGLVAVVLITLLITAGKPLKPSSAPSTAMLVVRGLVGRGLPRRRRASGVPAAPAGGVEGGLDRLNGFAAHPASTSSVLSLVFGLIGPRRTSPGGSPSGSCRRGRATASAGSGSGSRTPGPGRHLPVCGVRARAHREQRLPARRQTGRRTSPVSLRGWRPGAP